MVANKNKGIVLTAEDKTIQGQAKNRSLQVIIDDSLPLAFGKTLFTEPGIRVPWDLINAAWHFLERWDAAVPLLHYKAMGADVGTKEERKYTESIVRDLRVLLHSVELLFVRDSEDGRALMDTYREELTRGENKRLAFLRAMYLVKPRVCVLPQSWLSEIYTRARMDAVATRGRRMTGPQLVEVEIAPGRFVKCNPGDENKILEALKGGRRG